MTYTMEDFNRQYAKEFFAKLTLEEQRDALERLSPEHRRELLQALLSEEEVRQLVEQLAADRAAKPSKSRRKK